VVARLAGRTVSPEKFVATARFLDLFDPVLDHIARRTAVLEAARREKAPGSIAELQAEADAYRRVLGLHRAQDMNAWLAQVGYTLDEFEEEMEFRVLRRRKRASFTSKEVETCFHDERSDFDRARISQIVVAAEGLARELVEQVNSEKKDFHKLAAQHSLDEATRDAGGVVGWVRRRDMLPDLAARVFSAPAGLCVAPVKLADDAYQVVLVHETRTASLDPPTEEEVRDTLLARWLDGLAQEARR
jgi:peptidylprolyl isomerase